MRARKLLNINCIGLAANLPEKMADHGRCARQWDDHCKRSSRVGNARPGGNMRKLGACSVLAACVFCFLGWLTPLKAHADNVTLTLENVGPGNNSGGVYTYPYNFSIDGNGSYVSLMCFDYKIRSTRARPGQLR